MQQVCLKQPCQHNKKSQNSNQPVSLIYNTVKLYKIFTAYRLFIKSLTSCFPGCTVAQTSLLYFYKIMYLKSDDKT